MEDNNFDVLVVGTSLTESITAAALSKAGLKVLHVDSSPDYGGRDASLSLKDLVAFADSPPPQLRISKLSNPIPASDELLSQSRHYSISLSPSILPATGPLITSLVQSGVSRYGTFKLLDAIGIYRNGLVETIPASKEDVFKSKALSLIEKRKLMKFLMFASGEFENSDSLQGKQGIPFSEFLKGPEFGLSTELASAIAYALAHCSREDEPTLSTLLRLRGYIRSTGRYGNSPFLVGHYGGAGELSQGFCRTCAVSGGTYILGKDFKIELGDNTQPFKIHLEGIDESLSAKVIVAEPSQLPETIHAQPSTPEQLVARCIAIIDQPVRLTAPVLQEAEGVETAKEGNEQSEIDSFLIVFPPGIIPEGASQQSVSVMVTGEGSMSCPSGIYILYLSVVITADKTPEEVLNPYLQAALNVNRTETERVTPIFSLFYAHPSPSSSSSPPSSSKVISITPPSARLAEFGDGSVDEAEKVFWLAITVLGIKRSSLPKQDGESGDQEEDVVSSFWPPLEREDTSAVDEW